METTDSAEEGVTEKHARRDGCDTEKDTEGGGESEHLNHTQGTRRGTNIYLMDSERRLLQIL